MKIHIIFSTDLVQRLNFRIAQSQEIPNKPRLL